MELDHTFERRPDKPLHATDKKVDKDGVLSVQHVHTPTMPAQTDTTMHDTSVDTVAGDESIEQQLLNKDPVAEDGEIQPHGYCNMIYDYQNIIYTILGLWINCSLRQPDEGTERRTRAPIWRPDGSKLFRIWLEEVQEWITEDPTMSPTSTANAIRRIMEGPAREHVHNPNK